MKKRLIVWLGTLLFLLFTNWNAGETKLLQLTGSGLLLGLIGAIFLNLDRPTTMSFEKDREKRDKQFKDMKAGRPAGLISMQDISHGRLKRMLHDQYNIGVFFLVLGFIFQFTSVIIQIYA